VIETVCHWKGWFSCHPSGQNWAPFPYSIPWVCVTNFFSTCPCNNQFLILHTSALKMEVAYSSETLVSTSVATKITVWRIWPVTNMLSRQFIKIFKKWKRPYIKYPESMSSELNIILHYIHTKTVFFYFQVHGCTVWAPIYIHPAHLASSCFPTCMWQNFIGIYHFTPQHPSNRCNKSSSTVLCMMKWNALLKQKILGQNEAHSWNVYYVDSSPNTCLSIGTYSVTLEH
jgi:hypothetical protein